MNSISNVLSIEDLEYINQLPEVLEAKERLNSCAKVYFSITLTDSIRSSILTKLGLDLSGFSSIPMRWIKGNTAPHIDRAVSDFENTYLVYLNDCPGEFLLGDTSYPITRNTGYVFNEGLSHETINTEDVPRLLLGPMNELAQPVGSSVTFYYPSQQDALDDTNALGVPTGYGTYTIYNISGYTHWRLASNSTGPSSQSVVYTVGNTLIGDFVSNIYRYNLYPTAPCFLEGTKILALIDGKEEYVTVEELKKGTLVKTSRDGYKPVVLIGKGTMHNPGNEERIEDRLYKCSPSKYPELNEDLYLTGCHSILEFPITEKQKEDTIKHLGRLFVTDKKYRLMACVDERAEPWNSEGTYTIWHFALEHADDGMNYGVYANGGLLVETCAIRTLKNRSNMLLI